MLNLFFNKKTTKPEIKPITVGPFDSKEKRDKILACMYGGALGDSLGFVVEFQSWPQIQIGYGENGVDALSLSTNGKAIVSDDTQMTLFTAEGIGLGFERAWEKGISASVEDYIYDAYLCWLKTQGRKATSSWEPISRLLETEELYDLRAPGNTCLSALSSGKMGTIEEPINNSKGCGGVMRTAPLGFLRLSHNGNLAFGAALENGAKAAAITHGHPMGWIPAGILSDIVDRCIYGNYEHLKDLIEDSIALACQVYGKYPEMKNFEKMLRQAIDLAEKNKKLQGGIAEVDEPAIRSIGQGWVGDEALAIAIYAALRYENDFRGCLCAAVNHSGDSDSTGAIAGNILGAFHGLDYIPQGWIEQLELTDIMEYLADMMQYWMDVCKREE